MQRIINWGGTTYYECQFDTPKDFELFAEYWNATIQVKINGITILNIQHETILL